MLAIAGYNLERLPGKLKYFCSNYYLGYLPEILAKLPWKRISRTDKNYFFHYGHITEFREVFNEYVLYNT